MAAFYGLRRSEVVGVKWEASDFENKKSSMQHTGVTAKVNGTLTEIARDLLNYSFSKRKKQKNQLHNKF